MTQRRAKTIWAMLVLELTIFSGMAISQDKKIVLRMADHLSSVP